MELVVATIVTSESLLEFLLLFQSIHVSIIVVGMLYPTNLLLIIYVILII